MKFYEIDPLYEAKMSPSAFGKAVEQGGDIGVLVGYEFEVCIPKASLTAYQQRQRQAETEQPVDAGDFGSTTVKGWLQTFSRLDNVENNFDKIFESRNFLESGEPDAKQIIKQYFKQTLPKNLPAFIRRNTIEAYRKLKDRYSFLSREPAPAAQQIIGMIGSVDDWHNFMQELYERKSGFDINNAYRVRDWIQDYNRYSNVGNLFSNELAKPVGEELSKIQSELREAERSDENKVGNFYRLAEQPGTEEGNRLQIVNDFLRFVRYDWEGSEFAKFETAASRDLFARWCKETFGTDRMRELCAPGGPWIIRPGQARAIRNLFTGHSADYDPSRYRSGGVYKQAAEFTKYLIAPELGTTHIFERYHGGTKNMTDWYIEPDGSLRPKEGDAALEVVGPPQKAPLAMQSLKKFYQIAKANDFYTGKSYNTGLHINVSVPKELDLLKLAIFLGDEHVLKEFGRENNSYVNSTIKHLRYEGQNMSWAATSDKMAKLKSIVDSFARQHMASMSFESRKYISFRHAGGDYLNQPEEVQNVVGRFVRAMLIASDPTAYRQEYITKAVKFAQGKTRETRDSVNLLKKVREEGIPYIRHQMYIMRDGDYTEQDIQAAVHRLYNDNVTAANIRQGEASTQQGLVDISSRPGSGWSADTKQRMRDAAPDRFVEFDVVPADISGIANINRSYDMDKAIGMYVDGNRLGAAVRTARGKLERDDPAYRTLFRSIVSQASDQMMRDRENAAQQQQQRQAELQTTGATSVTGAREARVVDRNGAVTTLMIRADFAEDAARVVAGMLDQASPEIQRAWRTRLPLRLQYAGATVPVNWPPQTQTTQTTDQPPEQSIYSIIDNRDGEILRTGQNMSWDEAVGDANGFIRLQGIPREDIRIIDMNANRSYFITGTSDEHLSFAGQTTGATQLQQNGPSVGYWEVWTLDRGQNNPIYRTTGTRSFDMVRDRVLREPGYNSEEGRRSLRFTNVGSGMTYNVDGRLDLDFLPVPGSTPQGSRWRIVNNATGDGTQSITGTWNQMVTRAQEMINNAEVTRDNVRIRSLDTGSVYFIDGTEVTAASMAAQAPQSTATEPTTWVLINSALDADNTAAVARVFANTDWGVNDAISALNNNARSIYDNEADRYAARIVNARTGETYNRRGDQTGIRPALLDRVRRAAGREPAAGGAALRAPHTSTFQLVNLQTGNLVSAPEVDTFAGQVAEAEELESEYPGEMQIVIHDVRTGRYYDLQGNPTTPNFPSSAATPTGSEPPSTTQPNSQRRGTWEIIDRDDPDEPIEIVTGTLEDAAAVAMNYRRAQGIAAVIFDPDTITHYHPETLASLDEGMFYRLLGMINESSRYIQ